MDATVNNTAEIINTVFANDKTEIHLGDGSKQIDSIKTKFDLITSFPPFGMRGEPLEINGFRTSHDFASTLLIQSSLLLNDNGKAVLYPIYYFRDDRLESNAPGGNYPIKDCNIFARNHNGFWTKIK